MGSPVEIWNMALSHLGHAKDVADEDEDSAEADACRRFWDSARDQTLRDFPWPDATKIRALSLVEEDPTDEWAYSYTYPSDCLDARRILSGTFPDTRQSRVPFRKVKNPAGSGLLLYTNQSEAQLEYTFRNEEIETYPADLAMVMSLRLAALIAPRVTGGDQFKLGMRAMALYKEELSTARANAANEEQPSEEPDPETVRCR